METDYIEVTEISGDDVTQEQIQRLCSRYYWAGGFCAGRDVAEVACGPGQGLGYLNSLSKTFEAGDVSGAMIDIARAHYQDRIPLAQFDATRMPYPDHSKDVIIIFEAIYYLPDVEAFITECRRVLKDNGLILIATANRDLYDFNPSPFSYRYHGVKELSGLFAAHSFKVDFWGDTPVSQASVLQKILRPIKKVAVALHLIPQSMQAKKILKKLVFGKLEKMPAEINQTTAPVILPEKIPADQANTRHKVIFCAAVCQKNG